MSDVHESLDLKHYAEVFEKKGLTDDGEVALGQGVWALIMGQVDPTTPENKEGAKYLRRYFAHIVAGASGVRLVLPTGERPDTREYRRALGELFLSIPRGKLAQKRRQKPGGRPTDEAVNDLIVETFARMKKEANGKGQRFTQLDAATKLAQDILPAFYKGRGDEPKEHDADAIIRQYRRIRAKADKVRRWLEDDGPLDKLPL